MPEEKDPTPGLDKATPPPAEPESKTGTVDNGNIGDAQNAAGEEPAEEAAPDDTFTSVDVKELPPELKSKYNAMLSDYKKKTAEAARVRRESESLIEKAKAYDTIASDESFVNYWNSLSKKQQDQTIAEAGLTDEEFSRAFESKESFTNFVRKAVQQSGKEAEKKI
jgi:hypothetical protein